MKANRGTIVAAILAMVLCVTTATAQQATTPAQTSTPGGTTTPSSSPSQAAQPSPPPVQQSDKNAPEVSTEDTSTTFKVKVNLVEVRVVVRDLKAMP